MSLFSCYFLVFVRHFLVYLSELFQSELVRAAIFIMLLPFCFAALNLSIFLSVYQSINQSIYIPTGNLATNLSIWSYPLTYRAFLKVVLKWKLSEIVIFTLLCGASKSFLKAFKALIKPFEAPQRSVKIKISLKFFSSSGIGTGRVTCPTFLKAVLSAETVPFIKTVYCEIQIQTKALYEPYWVM